MIDFDFLADLPAPEDDEPASLRSDIEDELADHLKCALRREILKDGNETAAETRVLDRFGDPRKLARRLWWQAMWSHIMGKRILSGLQWILTLAAVVLAGAVFWQQSSLIMELRTSREADTQKYEAIAEVMQELKTRNRSVAPASVDQLQLGTDIQIDGTGINSINRSAPPIAEGQLSAGNADSEPQSLTVKCVNEDGESLLNKSKFTLTLILDGADPLTGQTGSFKNGRTVFALRQPNRYQLHVEVVDGPYCDISVLVRPNEHRELTVVCPDPSKKAIVHLAAPPLPQELQARNCELIVNLFDNCQKLDGVEWRLSSSNGGRSQSVRFDSNGGSVVSITSKRTTNLRDAAREDRAVLLLPGTVRYRYEIDSPDVGTIAASPDIGNPFMQAFERGDNNWTIELPDEMLSRARQIVSTALPPVTAPGTAPPLTSSEVLQPSVNDLQDAPAVLSIKLVEGSADGPPVLGATALLSGEGLQATQIEESQPFQWDEKKRGMPVPDRVTPIKGNVFRFSGLKPDRYTVQIWLSNDQSCTQTILVRDEKPQELTITCPQVRGSDKSPVLITAPPLPEDLQQAGTSILCLLTPVPFESGNTKWEFVNKRTLVAAFHGNGELYFFEGANLSADTPPEDRVVFLPQSQFRIRTKVVKDDSLVAWTQESRWPKLTGGELIRSVTAGENRWTLEASEEMIAAARTEMANAKPTAIVPLTPQSYKQKIAADETPLGENSRWIIELRDEAENTPALTNVKLTFYDEQNASYLSNFISGGEGSAHFSPDASGRCTVGPIIPSRYQLKVELNDGRTIELKLPLIRPGQERIERIVCPKEASKTAAMITVPSVPEDLRDGIKFSAELLAECVTTDGKTWSRPTDAEFLLRFNSVSGLVDGVGKLDLRSAAQDDRAVLLPTGPYRLTLALTYLKVPKKARELAAWPPSEETRDEKFEFVATPGENKWDIKVPEEFWAKARAKLAELPKE